ncbi:MAG TPA: protein translocase subunit SecF, partial [Gemmatimonadaceae bacterium]|nr:protein translocase subunit SecF [Gemmatimonadaceae bacterium]
MLRILHDTSFDFIRWWKWAFGITVAFLALGLGSLWIEPALYSIEFTGGTLMQVEFASPADAGRIRSTLESAGIPGAEIQQFGSNREYTIRAQDASHVEAQLGGAETVALRIEAVLKEQFGADQLTIVRTEAVGPRVGAELRRGAIIAILISFAITLVYLSIRFEWRFAAAAIIATSHDIIGTVAFIALMNLEISLTIVAGLLTVLGYSLNDTIIIFDRVRENLRKGRKETLYETLN